ncbi:L,D-transpeptidase [Rhodobacter sp. SGA-6-6]|uniref:L,D-transpeptidase n=1 Tax=Rhodobacter sp. SGA-6-6 TaxID=2710882 RepID=UPI0013EA22E0|nr:L,D-transpeptidase [Rhodobacter sp. SGA-6-6]NGM47130.1 L,D-transpeptidase [Rhodobacter sp. SGA-6-6]
MILTGRLALSPLLRTPAFALAAALLLAGCVDPITGQPAGTPAAAGPELPKPEDNVYVAKSDGQYTVPALPVEQIPEAYRRQVVAYTTEQAPGTIIIDPSQRVLYYVLGKNRALRYGIAVGAEGFGWSGEAIVANKKHWPTWTPPKEMIARKPELAKWENGQPGGPTNPLGARAIYLTSNGVDYGYRIHGTPEWKSIGRNASSGCFRMINQDVMDLFERVKGGEKVIVLTSKGEMPNGLNIPKPPAVKKKAPAAAPVVAPPLAVLPPPSIVGGPAAPAAPSAEPAAAPATAPAVPAPAADTPPAAVPEAPAAAPEPAAPACPVPMVDGACPQD